ncbi:hypothetical protein BDC45DRAFT_174922 [Circinella umbellata]|nr:hypothetical protein BDC45DRAFT_174922 [Circinella umbellata]
MYILSWFFSFFMHVQHIHTRVYSHTHTHTQHTHCFLFFCTFFFTSFEHILSHKNTQKTQLYFYAFFSFFCFLAKGPTFCLFCFFHHSTYNFFFFLKKSNFRIYIYIYIALIHIDTYIVYYFVSMFHCVYIIVCLYFCHVLILKEE